MAISCSMYRSRIKSSHCRGKIFTKCRLRNGCKRRQIGKRKSYCRKRSNRKCINYNKFMIILL